jgi:hypothetical protein
MMIERKYAMATPALPTVGLVRFIPKNTSTTSSEEEPLIGEPCDPNQDVGLASYNSEPIHVSTFTGTSILNPGERTGEKVQVGRILSPLSEGEVGTIRCIGLNVSRGFDFNVGMEASSAVVLVVFVCFGVMIAF